MCQGCSQDPEAEGQRCGRGACATIPTSQSSQLSWDTIFWILHLFPGYLCFIVGMDFLLKRGEHHPVAAAVLMGTWVGFAVIAGILERRHLRQ
jgi:hypothetical protein